MVIVRPFTSREYLKVAMPVTGTEAVTQSLKIYQTFSWGTQVIRHTAQFRHEGELISD